MPKWDQLTSARWRLNCLNTSGASLISYWVDDKKGSVRMSTYETFFSVRVKGLVRNPCYETSFQSSVKGSVRNHGYGTFLLISWNGLVRNSLYETFWPFSGKGCVLNLVYETSVAMHQVEVPCETSFLRNEKRILPCIQVKFLFRFRKNPFFFTVYCA